MDELDKDNKTNIKTGLSSQEQLARIGIAKSVPQTMINTLDKTRQLMSLAYDELEDEGLTIENGKGEKVVNPTFFVLRDLQKMYNDTVRATVTVADLVENRRLRPPDEAKGQKIPKGVEIEYHDYSQNDEEVGDEVKVISPREQMEALKKAQLEKGGKK